MGEEKDLQIERSRFSESDEKTKGGISLAITIHDAGQSRFRTLAALAFPAILEQLLGTLVSYVDTAMVGGLGSYATAAVGVNAPVVWLVNGVFPAVGVGYAVLVAHAIGAGKEEQARHTISQSLLAVLVCGFTLFALLLSLSGEVGHARLA